MFVCMWWTLVRLSSSIIENNRDNRHVSPAIADEIRERIRKTKTSLVFARPSRSGHLTRLQVALSTFRPQLFLTSWLVGACAYAFVVCNERERACRCPARSLTFATPFVFPPSLFRALSLCLSGSLPVALSKTPRLHLPLLFICDIITRFVTLLSKRRCHAWRLPEQSFRSLSL